MTFKLWDRAKTWTPSDSQILTIGTSLECAGELLDRCIKGVVLLSAGYFAGEGLLFMLHAIGGK